MTNYLRPLALIVMCAGAMGACGSDGDSDGSPAGTSSTTGTSPEQTGSVCEAAAECYPNVAQGDLLGDALCLTDVRGGYCTHTCTLDSDCCAAEAECETSLAQVCSPFQSTGQMMCFLSCEPDDISDGLDEQEYCQREASRDFICRSSGGGVNNRKVCVPGDCGLGAACAADADCSGDLTCALTVQGGYCTRLDCGSNVDCPDGSRCVNWDEGTSFCLVECQQESDCSFCRGNDLRSSCSTDIAFADGDSSQAVCVPPR